MTPNNSDKKSILFQTTPLILFALFPVFAYHLNPILIFSLLIAVFVQQASILRTLKENGVFLVLLLQYPLIHLILLQMKGSAVPHENIAGVDSVDFWLVLTFSILLVFAYAFGYQGFSRGYRKIVPGVLTVSFFILSFVYVTFDGCRQTSFGFLPFFPAITFIALVFPMIGYKKNDFDYTLLFLLTMSVIVSGAFTESRGIFIAQVVALGSVAVFFMVQRETARMWTIVLSMILGVSISFALDHFKGCSFVSRVTIISNSIEQIQEVEPQSAGLRLKMWGNAIEMIKEKPLAGHGVGQDVQAALGVHAHVHNMYLSWLVWGGIISLLSGLLFVLAPIWFFLKSIKRNPNVLITLSGSAIWLISMVFDSFLAGGVFGEIFVFTTIFSARLATDMPDKSKT